MHGRVLARSGCTHCAARSPPALLWGLLAFTALRHAHNQPRGDGPLGRCRGRRSPAFRQLPARPRPGLRAVGPALLRVPGLYGRWARHPPRRRRADWRPAAQHALDARGVRGGCVRRRGRGARRRHPRPRRHGDGVVKLGAIVGADTIRGPFHPWHYVEPVLLFLAPGVLFCAGVAFAVGERTRSALPRLRDRHGHLAGHHGRAHSLARATRVDRHVLLGPGRMGRAVAEPHRVRCGSRGRVLQHLGAADRHHLPPEPAVRPHRADRGRSGLGPSLPTRRPGFAARPPKLVAAFDISGRPGGRSSPSLRWA